MCECVCACLRAHPFSRTDGVEEREGKRKEGSGGSMTLQSAETDGCGVITCRRGNKRACTLVKVGEQGEKLKERRWGGVGGAEKIDRSARICFGVFAWFGFSRLLKAYLH